jgi:DNA-binding MarR family transcriptional regulator
MSMDTPLLTTLVRRLHLVIRRRLLAELQAAGHPDLTAAHMYVFQSPGPDGVRPTELAGRTNMTKQAMNYLLDGLERGKYLERVPAPNDGRGSVLRLTDRGRDVERMMIEGSRRMERNWADLLGRDRLEELRNAIRDLDAVEADEAVAP